MISATSTPMMAMTTKSSIKVKAGRRPERWTVGRICFPSDRGHEFIRRIVASTTVSSLQNPIDPC
jgi:hypothetical protein